MKVEGTEMAKRVQKSVGTVETVLWEMTLVNQLSVIPEHRKYMGLGSLGKPLICIQWYTPVLRLG